MDSVVPADHRGKIKESETRKEYLDLVRGQRKLWDMRVTVITVVTGTLSTAPKGLQKEQEKVRI